MPERVALSRQHSADLALLAPDEDLAAVVQAERPDGPDVAIDTTGIAAIFPRCLELIRREGRISMQGYYPDPIAIDFHPAHVKRATVVFPCAWDDTGQVNDGYVAMGGDPDSPPNTRYYHASFTPAGGWQVVSQPSAAPNRSRSCCALRPISPPTRTRTSRPAAPPRSSAYRWMHWMLLPSGLPSLKLILMT